jgi:hypothetical protein
LCIPKSILGKNLVQALSKPLLIGCRFFPLSVPIYHLEVRKKYQQDRKTTVMVSLKQFLSHSQNPERVSGVEGINPLLFCKSGGAPRIRLTGKSAGGKHKVR